MQYLLKATLLLCILFLTSCFNIVEEVSLEKDGSGHLQTTINMNEMMSMLSNLLPDSLKKEIDLDKITAGNTDKYKNIKGISNVKIQNDDAYVYKFGFDFEDVDALNRMLDMNQSINNPLNSTIGTQYKIKKKKFYRSTFYNQEKDSPFSKEGIDMEQIKSLFKVIQAPTYKLVYNFPKRVKKVKVKDEKVNWSKEGKTVTLEYNLLDFLEKNGKVIEHQIKY